MVPVVGAAGSCGATTVSLALATAAGRGARVVECASASSSGLVAASTRELGSDDHGWVHGARDQVLLDRAAGTAPHPDHLPTPPPADAPLLTVVDMGSQVEQVVAGHGWLTRLLTDAPTVVVVARASVPGLRRLECCLHQIGPDRTLVAVVGPPAAAGPGCSRTPRVRSPLRGLTPGGWSTFPRTAGSPSAGSPRIRCPPDYWPRRQFCCH